ncbi:membrane protein insertase YidC [Chitinophaga nivalis]|uniref:Membrane protein insertase YidC n=1 Tax=Chitinophaga nivalis TaxID=2991709 RepID=A0ABT3IRZ7_9BACT|nr:membrane protein insertase YidC [Chitinophaga nivalis]MCW3463567.1 membrane protein insertase YidC [Chitinophaga nivalis]MCW3486743.1 membrane protein insertase YidC [Chitinophaga nivalis]
MDRNSVIGFLLLGVLLVGYIFFNQKQQVSASKEKARQDSIAALNQPKTPITDTAAFPAGSQPDSAHQALLSGEFGAFAAAATGAVQTTVVENDVVKITFSNKGGQPANIQLKAYKNYDGGPLMLQQSSFNRLSVEVPASVNKMLNSADLFFTAGQVQQLANGAQSITYRLNSSNPAAYLEFSYTLKPGSYIVDYNIHAVGFQGILPGNQQYLSLQWNSQNDKQEHDMQNERLNNQVHYMYTNDKHDYFTLERSSHEKLDNKLKWVSVKQQFFNTTLIAKNGEFSNADINTKVPQSANIVGQTFTTLQIPYNRANDFSFPIEIYYGPNHYKTLKSFDLGLQKIIPLGSGIFAFVKYVNIWIIIPVFNFLSGFIGNYGLIIILLTIFIRLLIAPFTYQSYVSQAKMKVLKPEIDALKAKHGEDQQTFGVEQMKLFKTAGVNPLGGCLPALLQLPILVAMYSFFPSSIELRQESFLWAKDLSSYDSIVNLPFNIPFYGDHVSLFTILMTITSLILAFYNRGMTDQSNPVMKYMPYMMPIVLLGIFNRLAAALTFYYFLSNVISILLQWVLQTFIINHDKIHAQIQENKKKPVSKSKWQEKLEDMQKRQQDIQQKKK